MALCPYCDEKVGLFEKAHQQCVLQYKQKALQAEHARLRRQQEHEHEQRLREGEERNSREYQEWRAQYCALVDKFLEIAERKVSVLDDYGDESWRALPKEIETLLLKTASADNHNVDSIRRSLFKPVNWQDRHVVSRLLRDPNTLLWKYFNLKSHLEAEFRSYHEGQKERGSSDKEFRNLTGTEFDTYLATVLSEHGFEEIRGTPTTGDQGADLIAKRGGRTIVVQAKRYEGSVDNRAVQEVASAVNFYGADEGWVITSGTFTTSAKALAQKNNVKLIDGRDLRDRKFE